MDSHNAKCFLDELCSHIDKNTWLEYFLNCRPFGGENWIDFEVEISKVIQSLDELRTTLKRGGRLLRCTKGETKNFDGYFESVKRVGDIKIVQKNPDIEKLNPNCVLSFNYSDTYEKNYGGGKILNVFIFMERQI